MSKNLKRGYTTGVHASIAFRSALSVFLSTNQKSIAFNYKLDNDDLDVTKNSKIVVIVSNRLEDLELNPIEHKPYIIDTLRVYAGEGVGVVTKDGLKVKKDYPAINPIPLDAISQIYRYFNTKKNIYCSIGIEGGEELSKQTANSKVGVIGGLSILGTSGFVKPISSIAYLDSIKTELSVAKADGYKKVILTIGNSSFEYAKQNYNIAQIVEIGNYIYDSIAIIQELKFSSIELILGIGKATKLAQGYKNTHNRFGSIDFNLLKENIRDEFNISVDIINIKTVKGIVSELKEFNLDREFYKFIEKRAYRTLSNWFRDIEIYIIIL